MVRRLIWSQNSSRYIGSSGIRDLCDSRAPRHPLTSNSAVTASAEGFGTSTRRRFHHHTVSGQLPDAQKPAPRPHRTCPDPSDAPLREWLAPPPPALRRASPRPLHARCRLRWSAHRSGDCSITTRCRASFLMLRNRHPTRTDASRASDAPSARTLHASRRSAHGNGFSVTASAEVVLLSIGRLCHHRMMSGNVCDGWKLVSRPYYGRCSRIHSLERSRGSH